MTSLAIRLEAYVQQTSALGAFDWATRNCCQFAAAWVREVEGLDAMPLVPTPDAKAAWRLIASYGGLAEAITEQLGRAPVAPADAQVGDVVMVPLPAEPGRVSVGICNGRTSLLLGADGVIVPVPTVSATHAWRIDEAGSARPRSLAGIPPARSLDEARSVAPRSLAGISPARSLATP